MKENKILEFSQKLNSTEQNKDFNASLDTGDLISQQKPTYTFYLACELNNATYYYGQWIDPLITLDEEDLKYFKKKYLPKIEDEYQKQLKELKDKYGR